MKSLRTKIVNRLGLHARAATQLVNCAAGFGSEIWIILGDRRVNAKSIMGVLTLAATRGSEIEIEADGDDAEVAIHAIEQLVRTRFGEEE
jgi:phosphocarrier protein HPr